MADAGKTSPWSRRDVPIGRLTSLHERVAGRLRPVALRLNLPALAAANAAVIVTLCALGAAFYLGDDSLHRFSLARELSVPAVYAALLLAATAGAALVLADEYSHGSRMRRTVVLLGVLFAFMSLDELGTFHERLGLLAGTPWQLVYAPLFAIAVGLALVVWWELRSHPPAAWVWAVGGIFWLGAPLLDLYQTFPLDNHAWRAEFKSTVVLEETLEMVGSCLLAGALLLALRRHAESWSLGGRALNSAAAPIAQLDRATPS